jgi:hypothetical protein
MAPTSGCHRKPPVPSLERLQKYHNNQELTELQLKVGPLTLIVRGIPSYLIDGGHIENRGIYELLRRCCQVIIAVDVEAGP